MKYAYARVSSKDQNLDRQIVEFEKIKDIDYVWKEKESGKNFKDRNVYQSMKKCLKPFDTLIIYSIDRLGRNYDEIMEEWNYYKRSNIYVQVLDMPLLDTSKTINGLDGRFIADLVLQILSYVAQKEREKIRERAMQGIKIAKEKGVRFGRPKKEIDKDKLNYYMQLYLEELQKNNGGAVLIKRQALQDLSISNGTWFKLLKEYK